MLPLVSVIIPVYNGSNYLAEAIDSALAQTYDNIEIIVVNDGSKDDGATERVAFSYGDKIRYILKENGGVSSALNRGIAEMKGEYFSWLSHDDLYTPEKIEKQVALIKDKKDIVLCSGSLISANGTPIKHKVKVLDKKLDGVGIFGEVLRNYALNGLGFLVPKSVFDKVGLFDETMRYLQDFDMWVRIMWYDYKFICHSDKLVISRVHKAQQTHTIPEQYLIDRDRLAIKHIEMLKTFIGSNKSEILEHYLYFFAKEANKKAFKIVEAMYLKDKSDSFKVKIRCLSYFVMGYLMNIGRRIRSSFLKV